jgi:hypothetical protein
MTTLTRILVGRIVAGVEPLSGRHLLCADVTPSVGAERACLAIPRSASASRS